jgi:hypothetical protein
VELADVLSLPDGAAGEALVPDTESPETASSPA